LAAIGCARSTSDDTSGRSEHGSRLQGGAGVVVDVDGAADPGGREAAGHSMAKGASTKVFAKNTLRWPVLRKRIVTL
jgi:hypothetical protein